MIFSHPGNENIFARKKFQIKLSLQKRKKGQGEEQSVPTPNHLQRRSFWVPQAMDASLPVTYGMCDIIIFLKLAPATQEVELDSW